MSVPHVEKSTDAVVASHDWSATRKTASLWTPLLPADLNRPSCGTRARAAPAPRSSQPHLGWRHKRGQPVDIQRTAKGPMRKAKVKPKTSVATARSALASRGGKGRRGKVGADLGDDDRSTAIAGGQVEDQPGPPGRKTRRRRSEQQFRNCSRLCVLRLTLTCDTCRGPWRANVSQVSNKLSSRRTRYPWGEPTTVAPGQPLSPRCTCSRTHPVRLLRVVCEGRTSKRKDPPMDSCGGVALMLKLSNRAVFQAVPRPLHRQSGRAEGDVPRGQKAAGLSEEHWVVEGGVPAAVR